MRLVVVSVLVMLGGCIALHTSPAYADDDLDALLQRHDLHWSDGRVEPRHGDWRPAMDMRFESWHLQTEDQGLAELVVDWIREPSDETGTIQLQRER